MFVCGVVGGYVGMSCGCFRSFKPINPPPNTPRSRHRRIIPVLLNSHTPQPPPQTHHDHDSGESYLDVIARLEPVVLEMERLQEPLLIVGHQVRTVHTNA